MWAIFLQDTSQMMFMDVSPLALRQQRQDFFGYTIHTLNIAQTHLSMREHISLKEGAVVC